MSDEPLIDGLMASWLADLERRFLAELTRSEVARALRALSSCYVERRSKLVAGGALDSAGKRAAFALFYGPMHMLVVHEILQALPVARDGIDKIVDLGCGTGAAGAAWGVAARARTILGIDRHPWAVAEATRTYRHFRMRGLALQADAANAVRRMAAQLGTGVVAAYALNELTSDARALVLPALLDASSRGAKVLIVEPIARGAAPWWSEWQAALERAGGRSDEWRFRRDLPALQQALADAAGLDPREWTARSLFL